MSYTVSLQQRIQQLKKAQANLPDILYQTAKGATMRAIEAAAAATPPRENDLRGVNTRAGGLKQHWATASKPEPMGGALSGGSSYTTILANDLEYASYGWTDILSRGCTWMRMGYSTMIRPEKWAWW